MYGYLWLYMSMYKYVCLCRAMKSYVRAMYGYVGQRIAICTVMYGSDNIGLAEQ